MSREKQVYSPVNQQAAISAYAELHGFEIVRTYADEGRSGLRLKGRAALQEMLRDVLSGQAGFEAILVFDVSRWGRFQDTDESAHYEFICKRAGVQVHYCAEMFANDGSLMSTVFKNLRRAMAGEFSRDLSSKVWAAQCRLTSLGFKMGGRAGYGLRRMLVDQDGKPKQILNEGEHKNITTDRVILIPGDPGEVATVRRIFNLAEDGLSNPAIAALLNADGTPAPETAKWSSVQVRQIVIAERYVGTCVYNKRSAKLRSLPVPNPQRDWVRREGAFEPIITARQFRAAQAKSRSSRHAYTDEQLLDHLRWVLAEAGHLTRDLIARAAPPAAKTFNNRFGSLERAYALIGYDTGTRGSSAPEGRALAAFAAEMASALEKSGHRVAVPPAGGLMTVDDRYAVSLRLCSYRYARKRGYWRVTLPRSATELTLAGLMKDDMRVHLYLIPATRFGRSGKIDISEGRNLMANYEVWDLNLLSDMIKWHAR